MPHLGRWASPDPLQIHAGGGGEFGNSYHYVAGNLLQATDPDGLDPPAQGTPATERALERSIEVSSLPGGATPDQELYFLGGPGPGGSFNSATDRTAFVSYANKNDLPIFRYTPGSDAPSFEAAVGARRGTATLMATNLIGLFGGEVPQRNGVTGGAPGGSGDDSNAIAPRAALAASLVVALGGAASRVGRRLYRAAWRATRNLAPQARRQLRRLLNRAWRSRGCFVAGTVVESERGRIPIEDIREGDFVLSRNEATGEQAYKRVSAIFVREGVEIYELTVADRQLNRELLETSAEHPFWVLGRGWSTAARLAAGDQLLGMSGHTLAVEGLVATGRTATVYNIQVEGFHTFFVGRLGAWVHNKGMRARGLRVPKIKGGPRFGALRDHAHRHGLPGQSTNQYYNAATRHARSGTTFNFSHNGAQKLAHVTRTGPDTFTFTSTAQSGRRIYTHIYGVSERYLNNLGITLPSGF